MTNVEFKNIYNLVEKLQLKNYEKEYQRLLALDNEIGSFEDYVIKSKKSKDNLNTNDNCHKNAIIINDVIKKENISINLYLINFKHIEQPELDENYKPLPLREKNIYEYGTVITFEDVSGEYAIENAFSGIEDTKELAETKYKNLKEETGASVHNPIKVIKNWQKAYHKNIAQLKILENLNKPFEQQSTISKIFHRLTNK